jgi:hypothetical protein
MTIRATSTRIASHTITIIDRIGITIMVTDITIMVTGITTAVITITTTVMDDS